MCLNIRSYFFSGYLFMLTTSWWCSFELVKAFSFESSCLIHDLRHLLTNRLNQVEIQMSKMETFSSSRPASQCEEGWSLYAQSNPEIRKGSCFLCTLLPSAAFYQQACGVFFFLNYSRKSSESGTSPTKSVSLHQFQSAWLFLIQ